MQTLRRITFAPSSSSSSSSNKMEMDKGESIGKLMVSLDKDQDQGLGLRQDEKYKRHEGQSNHQRHGREENGYGNSNSNSNRERRTYTDDVRSHDYGKNQNQNRRRNEGYRYPSYYDSYRNNGPLRGRFNDRQYRKNYGGNPYKRRNHSNRPYGRHFNEGQNRGGPKDRRGPIRLACFECGTRPRRKFLLQKRPCRHLICRRCVMNSSEQNRQECHVCSQEMGEPCPIRHWFACGDQSRFIKDVTSEIKALIEERKNSGVIEQCNDLDHKSQQDPKDSAEIHSKHVQEKNREQVQKEEEEEEYDIEDLCLSDLTL